MRPLAVDLVLLRSTAPDLPLVVGRVLAARVVERHGQHGVINLAGAYLTAELPDEVQAGDRLRLTVRELTAERVVLEMVSARTPSGPQVPPAAAEAALAPDDRVVLLGREDEPERERGERAHVVVLRFEGAAIGTVELRVALVDELVHVRAALTDGQPLALARARSGALREALAHAAGRPAEVEVVTRPRPLDVYV